MKHYEEAINKAEAAVNAGFNKQAAKLKKDDRFILNLSNKLKKLSKQITEDMQVKYAGQSLKFNRYTLEKLDTTWLLKPAVYNWVVVDEFDNNGTQTYQLNGINDVAELIIELYNKYTPNGVAI